MVSKRFLAAMAVAGAIILSGCEGEEDPAANSTGDGGGAVANLNEGGEADGARDVSRVDPDYVERVTTQIAELEITFDAMKAAAATHPDDELLAKLIERTEKKLPTARKKIEHLQKVARDENIAELQAEIDELLTMISDAVSKGVKRAAKLDEMPEREPRKVRNAEEGEGDVVDDGGEADDGSGDRP